MNTKNSRLVYSTDQGKIQEDQPDAIDIGDGIVRIRRETKGRKGKGVTTISGLAMSVDEKKALAKKLKQLCGTGGSIKNGMIEIQGDQRDTIKEALASEGIQAKLAGG